MKKIVIVTGIRSEYDILYSLIKKLHNDNNYELYLIVLGIHLSPNFGKTINNIQKDGFDIYESIETAFDSNTLIGRGKSIGVEIINLTQTLQKINPDYLIVCGDREEMFGAAISGLYLNIPICHLSGGDITIGNIDDSVRHAITKISHLHFPFSENSAKIIEKMGEEKWRIHNVGNSSLDKFNICPKISRKELSKKLNINIDNCQIMIMIQHAVSSEIEKTEFQINETLSALQDFTSKENKLIIIKPNSDTGSDIIKNAINKFEKDNIYCKSFDNLARNEFVNLLKYAKLLIGNSSMGLAETPFLKLPTINIGNRQKGRFKAKNIFNVEHNKQKIKDIIKYILYNNKNDIIENYKHPFGDGNSADKIINILNNNYNKEKLIIKNPNFN